MKSKRVFAAVLTAMLSAAVCLTPLAVSAAETTAETTAVTTSAEDIITLPSVSITEQVTGTDPTVSGMVITEDANPSDLVGTWVVDSELLKDSGIASIELALTDTGTGTMTTTLVKNNEKLEQAVTYGYDGKTLTYAVDGKTVTCTMAKDKKSLTSIAIDGEKIKLNKTDDFISIGSALIFAAIGLGIVFFVLLVLNGFIRLQSVIVRSIESGASKKPEPAAAPAAAAPAADAKPAIPAGMKPADGSLGDVKLYNVDDATAAMIMAIVADQLEAPLNELRFKSIKEVTK